MRHGRTTANTSGVLAGWSPGVELDETGVAQVKALARRLKPVPITHVVSSPLTRTMATARILVKGRNLSIVKNDQVGELDYGKWTGQQISKLVKDSLWAAVQAHPSSVTFPHGESMHAAQVRAVAACRKAALHAADERGEAAVVLVVTHGDIIKAVLADALGMHLDMFQRIVVDPASLSVVSYAALRPFVERVNDCGGDVKALIPDPKKGRDSRKNTQATPHGDAVVGGGSGPGHGRR